MFAQRGFGVSKDMVNHSGPGRRWWEKFLKRWPELTLRSPEHLSKSRVQASTPEVINMFFDGLEVCFREHGFFKRSYGDLASRIFNCDEVGFATVVASSKVFAKERIQECI